MSIYSIQFENFMSIYVNLLQFFLFLRFCEIVFKENKTKSRNILFYNPFYIRIRPR